MPRNKPKKSFFNLHKYDKDNVLPNDVTLEQAERWLKFYKEHYPNYEFELVHNLPAQGENDGKEESENRRGARGRYRTKFKD